MMNCWVIPWNFSTKCCYHFWYQRWCLRICRKFLHLCINNFSDNAHGYRLQLLFWNSLNLPVRTSRDVLCGLTNISAPQLIICNFLQDHLKLVDTPVDTFVRHRHSVFCDSNSASLNIKKDVPLDYQIEDNGTLIAKSRKYSNANCFPSSATNAPRNPWWLQISTVLVVPPATLKIHLLKRIKRYHSMGPEESRIRDQGPLWLKPRHLCPQILTGPSMLSSIRSHYSKIQTKNSVWLTPG